jgi:hypothetical protein
VTRSEIIELANQLTERKGERVLNLQSLYTFVLQDICKRQRFWWRRIAFSFQLAAGTPTYDLTTVTTVPANVMTGIAIEEITKLTVILTPSPYQVAEYVPVFDPEAIIDMIYNTSVVPPLSPNPTGQPGGRYTMDANDYKTLRIDPPDNAYTAFIVGWAMPNPTTDSASDTVPLIPPWGHNTIVEGMNAKIFRFAYGSKNEKTTDAQAAYELGIQDLESKRQFDPNYRLQLSLSESAVRST